MLVRVITEPSAILALMDFEMGSTIVPFASGPFALELRDDLMPPLLAAGDINLFDFLAFPFGETADIAASNLDNLHPFPTSFSGKESIITGFALVIVTMLPAAFLALIEVVIGSLSSTSRETTPR